MTSKKGRCKYWESCYRKNEQHLAEYTHPCDLVSSSKTKVKLENDNVTKSQELKPHVSGHGVGPSSSKVSVPIHQQCKSSPKNSTSSLNKHSTISVNKHSTSSANNHSASSVNKHSTISVNNHSTSRANKHSTSSANKDDVVLTSSVEKEKCSHKITVNLTDVDASSKMKRQFNTEGLSY